jgi:hypothetical protein
MEACIVSEEVKSGDVELNRLLTTAIVINEDTGEPSLAIVINEHNPADEGDHSKCPHLEVFMSLEEGEEYIGGLQNLINAYKDAQAQASKSRQEEGGN